jgi:arsenate reductase (glutaredoxin)
MAKIVIYEKRTCTTCRQVHALLKERGVDVDAVDYYLDPIPRAKLVSLLKKMGLTPRDLVRTTEPIYKILGLRDRSVTDDELIDAMVEHPDLMQRPIVETGDRAILARPASRIVDIL